MMVVPGVRGLTLAAALLAVPALARAQDQQFAQPDTHHTWRSSAPDASFINVTYFIGAGFDAAQTALIQQAAAAWSYPATGAYVNLVEGGAGSDISLTQLTFPFFADAVLTNTSTTTTPIGTAPDGHYLEQISDADITLVTLDGPSPGSPWNNDVNSPPGPGQWDFYSIILREFGLALGLGTTLTDPASVMTPGTPGPGTFNHTLSQGDLQALQHMYGTPEPTTFALFGLGLLGVGLARRKRARDGHDA
jgi:hypothetical protein